jgi:acyl-CoA synthetase (NDP forming)
VVPPGIDVKEARAAAARARATGDDRWLSPEEARSLLEAYGIPLVPERTVHTEADAIAAAAELGFPVAAKTAAAGAHKTEAGGVALNIGDERDLREALGRVGLPAVVQKMVTGGAELLAGVVQDPVFGPLVAFGPGGVLAELIGDANTRIAPLTDADAGELVTTGKAGRLVRGFRGPATDHEALIDLVQRLAQLADDLPEVAELDLNPVIALERGCVAVDARIRLKSPERQTAAKTW